MTHEPAPSYVGQLLNGPANTPLYRLKIYPDRIELKYRTVKVIAAHEIEAVEPWRLPILGWFVPSGLRIRHRSTLFSERLIFKTFRVGSVLDDLDSAGYPVQR